MDTPIFVTRPSMPDLDEYIREITDIWETHQLTNSGPKHTALESALKSYMKVDGVELVTNGHMALELAIQALNLKGEVITTPYTFVSTALAIVRNQLVPVFCDIDLDTFTLDPAGIEERITENTCAIVPVHVYGNLCNTEEIGRIAQKHGLKVIYDAAHCFGETYLGRSVASFGDISCFSFHATKVFNTVEGGALCFRDPDIGRKVACLRNFGFSGAEDVSEVGVNAKMNELCAAMGLCNLRHIEDEIQKRKRVYERYQTRLSGVEGLRLNVEQEGLQRNFAYFPVIFDERSFGAGRDEVQQALAAKGIGARKYFYPPVNAFSCFRGQYDAENTPKSLWLSRRVLTLPIYGELSNREVDEICEIILALKK